MGWLLQGELAGPVAPLGRGSPAPPNTAAADTAVFQHENFIRIGSRRKTVLIAEMLRQEGISDQRIHAIHAPVGLDLGGRTPAEIALSVLAEITQQRYQASGRPLGQRLQHESTRGHD